MVQAIEKDKVSETLEENENCLIVRYKSELNPRYFVKEPELSPKEKEMIATIQEYALQEASVSSALLQKGEEEGKNEFAASIESLLKRHLPHLSEKERATYRQIMIRNAFGYGKLQPLVEDENLEEIMVNGFKTPVVVAHKDFGMCETNIVFDDEKELKNIVDRIARVTKRKIDILDPMLDARLADGSRVNATLPPISLDGITLTIRKFKRDPLTILDLIKFGTLDSKSAAFLWMCVEGLGSKPLNILVAGGTGSGKTTTLNCLADFIPVNSRVITIEDTAELNFKPFLNLVRMETREPNVEGKGEVDMGDLMRNSLRMRPDRIIVGEIRGDEARTLFTAMNTGHDGCMGTLHANSAEEVISRLSNDPMNVPLIMLPALHILVIQRRMRYKGKNVRRVTEIAGVQSQRKGNELVVNTYSIFDWDAKTDGMSEIKSTRPLETIRDFSGVSLNDIMGEIEVRKNLLEWMVESEIEGRKELRNLVQTYYADKDHVLDMIIGGKNG